MARPDASAANVEAAVDAEVGAAPVAKPKFQPMYKIINSEVKIPVSKSQGKVWKGRIESCKASRKNSGLEMCWDEGIRYYNNDQTPHRNPSSTGNTSGNTWYARRPNEQWTETENIVFANVNAVSPSLIAKEPKPEITASDPAKRELATVVENVVYTLSQRIAAPGLNLKTLAKQAVVHAQLTNCSWMEVGWVYKSESSEQAMANLQTLATELEKADTPKKVEEVEGKIQALESKIDFLRPSGPYCKFYPAHRVYVDPCASLPDKSDAWWIATQEWYPTGYLNAMYGAEAMEDGRIKSLYNPTHILRGDTATAEDQSADNFKLFNTGSDAASYGYKSQEAFDKSKYTMCWRIWDKTTRRVYLYIDEEWDWPVWVFPDKYQFPNFFPFDNLAFLTPAIGAWAKGEVTYYLDQQDAVNDINTAKHRARWQAQNKLFYDLAAITPQEAQKFIDDPKRQLIGLKLPEGKTIDQCFFSMPPVALRFKEIFDKNDLFAAANRISGTSTILRNEEFKTNTTNRAIENYESSTQTFLDSKLDPIEDWLGGIYAKVAQLCLINWAPQDVIMLVGEEQAQQWKQMSADELLRTFSMRVVGGSTQKPTSSNKKKEALAISQMAGQFAAKSPTVIAVILRLWSNAFDGIEMRKEDWDRLRAEFDATVGGGAAGPTAGEPSNASGDPAAVIHEASALVDGMPPQAKQALGQAIAQGVPLEQAVAMILKALPQTTPVPQEPAPTPQGVNGHAVP